MEKTDKIYKAQKIISVFLFLFLSILSYGQNKDTIATSAKSPNTFEIRLGEELHRKTLCGEVE